MVLKDLVAQGASKMWHLKVLLYLYMKVNATNGLTGLTYTYIFLYLTKFSDYDTMVVV